MRPRIRNLSICRVATRIFHVTIRILRAPPGQSKERLSLGSPLIPGLLLAGSPSPGGDVYIARPFWERPFKLLVYDHRVDKTPRALTYVGFRSLEVARRSEDRIGSNHDKGCSSRTCASDAM